MGWRRTHQPNPGPRTPRGYTSAAHRRARIQNRENNPMQSRMGARNSPPDHVRGHAWLKNALAQRRPTRLTGPPRFIGVPARTPTPGAPTPTRPTPTAGVTTRPPPPAPAAPRSPSARRPSCSKPPRPGPNPRRPGANEATAETAASVKTGAQPTCLLQHLSSLPHWACSLAMCRSVTAADARCTWSIAGRGNIP